MNKPPVKASTLGYALDLGKALEAADTSFWRLYSTGSGSEIGPDQVTAAHDLVRELQKAVKAAQHIRHSVVEANRR